jgi:hypothetical protein
MRLVLSVLAFAVVLGAGFGLLARADDPAAPTPEALAHRLATLDLQVQYLLSREKAHTAYVMETQARARALAQALRSARDEGFTAGAISSTSREVLLAGLEDLAKDLTRLLPEVTREEKELLEQANRRK